MDAGAQLANPSKTPDKTKPKTPILIRSAGDLPDRHSPPWQGIFSGWSQP
jgi:hypothetical protein